jgi:hypothetical protein
VLSVVALLASSCSEPDDVPPPTLDAASDADGALDSAATDAETRDSAALDVGAADSAADGDASGVPDGSTTAFVPSILLSDWDQYPLGNLEEPDLVQDRTSWHDWAGNDSGMSQGTIVASPAPPAGMGMHAMELHRASGRADWGANFVAARVGGTTVPNEFWWSWWIHLPSGGFDLTGNPIYKFMRLQTDTGTVLWRWKSGGGYDVVTTVGGTVSAEAFGDAGNSWRNGYDEWAQYEIYIRVSATDPEIRCYRNGSVIFESSSLPTSIGSGGVRRWQFVPEMHGLDPERDLTSYYTHLVITDSTAPPPNRDAAGRPIIGSWTPR